MNLQLRLKYAIDRLAAAVMLILCTPFFLVIAVLIVITDRGPVFFRQERVGVGGKPFTIWKFRTMVVDADTLLNADGSVAGNRVTRIGRVLRFLSLDELPQLFNIMLGDMSIVGPRPTLPDHYARYTAEQRRRVLMRPGITGLAQINGRNTLRWSKRIQFDIQYIDNFSLWLDLSILLKTIVVAITRRGISEDRNPHEVDDLARVIDGKGAGESESRR